MMKSSRHHKILRHHLCFILLWLCYSLSSQSLVLAQTDELINTPIADKWALVIGISSFANPKMNLNYAAKDATDFRNFLVNKCHFSSDHIKLLTNEAATKDHILDVLGDSWLPRVSLPEDLVVIFISSHGSPSSMDVAGINYLVAHDTNPDKLFTTGIPIQHLADTIKERVHSKRVLVIMDACHSGGATDSSKAIVRTGNVDAAAIAQGTGQAVICSSSKNEASWEARNSQNGVFTKALIESLQTNGEATKLSEAFSKLKDKVQQQVVAERGVTQTPVLETSKWQGEELALLAPASKPRPAPVLPDNFTQLKPATEQTNAAPGVADPRSADVPDISGDFAGSNGLSYHYWQKGRKCGWSMPALGMAGTGLISEDGKTMDSRWTGMFNGRCNADLECDESGRVKRIVCDNGTILSRVELPGK